MKIFKKCLGIFFMSLMAFAMCGNIVPRSYLDNSPIVIIPVVLHLYEGQIFEDAESQLIDSQEKLSKGKIVLKVISVDHNAPLLDVYDVGGIQKLDEKSISDRDEYLHIFFVRKLINSKIDIDVVGYHVNWWNEGYKCSSFIIIADDASTTTIAHEVGHELGLRHTKEKLIHKRNIMYPKAIEGRVKFSRKQIVKMRERALRRNATCKAKFQGLKI